LLGIIGYAINTLTTTETTLSAFLVISAFYLLLGVIGLFKAKPEYASEKVQLSHSSRNSDLDGNGFVEEAAA
jgi:hypothetical protein